MAYEKIPRDAGFFVLQCNHMADTQGDIYISREPVLSGSNIPSSPEVVVRTMASDLASISQGGGGAPRGETVKGAAIFESAKKESVLREHSRSILLVLIVLGSLVIVGAALFMGYYLIRPFFDRPPVSVPIETPTPGPTEIFQ